MVVPRAQCDTVTKVQPRSRSDGLWPAAPWHASARATAPTRTSRTKRSRRPPTAALYKHQLPGVWSSTTRPPSTGDGRAPGRADWVRACNSRHRPGWWQPMDDKLDGGRLEQPRVGAAHPVASAALCACNSGCNLGWLAV